MPSTSSAGNLSKYNVLSLGGFAELLQVLANTSDESEYSRRKVNTTNEK